MYTHTHTHTHTQSHAFVGVSRFRLSCPFFPQRLFPAAPVAAKTASKPAAKPAAAPAAPAPAAAAITTEDKKPKQQQQQKKAATDAPAATKGKAAAAPTPAKAAATPSAAVLVPVKPASPLAALDATLLRFSYVTGFVPTAEDAKQYAVIADGPAVSAGEFPNVARWAKHMASFTAAQRAAFA